MLLWLAPAHAQDPPSAARLCAEAAEGTEVEVCLKLAASRPDEVDEVAAALLAHVDQGSSADRELLGALLLLLADETGSRGAAALGALGDERAVPPLVHAVGARPLPVALAAVDALGAYRAGLEPLSAWLLDDDRPLEVRVRAADVLGRTERPEAADALIDALRRRGLPPALRLAMLDAVRTHHPERSGELVHRIHRDGTTWMSVTGAVSVGYAMAVAGRFSEFEVAGIGAVAGTVAGGTTGYLIGRAAPTEADDAAFVAVNGLVGTAAGVALGAGLLRGRPDAVSWTGLGGEVVGLTAGVVLARPHRGTPGDSVEAAAMGLALATVLGGALDVGVKNGLSDPEASGTHPPLLGAGIGLIAGTVLGHAIAPRVSLERNDWALVALSTGTGAALGALAPLAGNERGALPAVGGAAGALAGLALAGSVDPDWDALGSGVLGAGYGSLVVGGAAAWARPDDQQLIGGAALLGGVAGLGVGGMLADIDQEPIDDRDVVLMAFASGWAAAQTAGVLQLTEGDPFARVGPLLVVPSLAGATVAALSPVIDVPVPHSSAAVSLGLWGAYVGGSTGELLVGDSVVAATAGGTSALVIGAIGLSPFVGLSPTTVAMADAGGILGAGLGLGLGRAVGGSTDGLLIGGLIGAGAGFTGGAIAGQALRRSGATRDLAIHVPRPDVQVTVVPAMVDGAQHATPGVRIGVHGW
jgi:hypothetical protein